MQTLVPTLTFPTDMPNITGTSLRGYLHAPWPYAETVARLVALTGQQPDPDGDTEGDGKVSVEFVGYFDGELFVLYDYKGDQTIHIGLKFDFTAPQPTQPEAFVAALSGALIGALMLAQPAPFRATERYDTVRHYGWPA